MTALDAGYINDRTTIQIVANLPLGWCYAGQGQHRFHVSDKLDFDAFEARIHLDVHAHPDTVELPFLAPVLLRIDQGLQWEMSNNILRVYVKMHENFILNPDLPWESTGRRNCIIWRQVLGVSRGYQVSAKLVVAFDIDLKKAGDIVEWDTVLSFRTAEPRREALNVSDYKVAAEALRVI